MNKKNLFSRYIFYRPQLKILLPVPRPFYKIKRSVYKSVFDYNDNVGMGMVGCHLNSSYDEREIFQSWRLYLLVMHLRPPPLTRAVPGGRGGVTRPWPPPIGQDFKGYRTTFWPSSRAFSIRYPPQSKILEPPMISWAFLFCNVLSSEVL